LSSVSSFVSCLRKNDDSCRFPGGMCIGDFYLFWVLCLEFWFLSHVAVTQEESVRYLFWLISNLSFFVYADTISQKR